MFDPVGKRFSCTAMACCVCVMCEESPSFRQVGDKIALVFAVLFLIAGAGGGVYQFVERENCLSSGNVTCCLEARTEGGISLVLLSVISALAIPYILFAHKARKDPSLSRV